MSSFEAFIWTAHTKTCQVWFMSHLKMQWHTLKSNLTYISNVFLRRQAESRQVLCVALSKSRCLFSLSANQMVWGEIKIDAACPTLKCTRTIQKLSAMHSNGVSQYFKIKSHRNLTLNHLHLGDKAELVFDLQEDGVEGQLVGLLVESGQSRSGLC